MTIIKSERTTVIMSARVSPKMKEKIIKKYGSFRAFLEKKVWGKVKI